MPDLETVPTDVVTNDLVRTYHDGIGRLEGILNSAVNRGLDPSRIGTPDQLPGDATAAYRERQLLAALTIVQNLEETGRRAPLAVTSAAYGAAIRATDRTVERAGLGRAGIGGRFGGVHQRAVEVLAANMQTSLTGAAQRLGENVQAVFARADMLEGAHRPGASPLRGFPFIGRRLNDPWRKVALETIGAGTIAMDTRRQISRELARRLIDEAVTDGITGFVDRAGRRWPLHVYAEMVARTTTREATTRATTGRLLEHGIETVRITSHPHQADLCSPYDGRTFALPGTAAAQEGRYPVLDRLPPFHPRCRHVVAPAGNAALDEYEAELQKAANEAAGAPQGLTPTMDPPASPFGPAAGPSYDDATARALEAQRLIAGDPGPDPDAMLARWAEVDAEDLAGVKRQKAERNARRRALREAMSEDLGRELGLIRATRPNQWVVEEGIVERLEAGELTIADVEQMTYEHYAELEAETALREITSEVNYGTNTRAVPCFSCGKLKALPADICEFCGDDPLTLGETAGEFNRAYGYEGVGTESRKAAGSFRGGHGAKRERTGQWNG